MYELQTLAVSRDIKDKLEEVDLEIQKKFKQLNKDDYLVSKS